MLQLNYNKVVKSAAGQMVSSSSKKGKGKKSNNKRIFNQPKSPFFDKKKTKKN